MAFKDMTPAARAAAHELMQAGLSTVGDAKAVDVIRHVDGVVEPVDHHAVDVIALFSLLSPRA